VACLRRPGLPVLALVLSAALAPPIPAQVPEPGFSSSSYTLAPGGAFVGGLESLANGNLVVYDGAAVVEIARADGSFVRTIFTPPGAPFGAFLRLAPDLNRLYFGESSSGYVWELDLAGGTANIVASLVFPYDLAFDPQGNPYVSYATSFSDSHVAAIDFTTGIQDDVIDFADPSGPIVFDAAGNLYTASTHVPGWPPPPDAATLYFFDAAELAGALGPSVLTAADGTVLGNLDGASSLALDEKEDLIVTDPNGGRAVQVTPATGRKETIALADAFSFLGYVVFAKGTRGAFEPWQPEEAGTLLVTETDFFSFNVLATIAPRRPPLAATPASPIPVGPFDVDVEGEPNGFGLLLLAPAGITGSELELANHAGNGPLFFGLDLSAGLLLFPLAFDANGAFHASATNPGLGGGSIGLQVAVGPAGPGALLGTSAPTLLTFQ